MTMLRAHQTTPEIGSAFGGKNARGSNGIFARRMVFKKIDEKDLAGLQNQLNLMAKSSHDPFAHSAAYFGMTGRDGLWIYGDETGFVLIARHPNDPKSVLIFPPYGDADVDTIKEAMSHKRFPSGNVELARANPLNTRLYKAALTNGKTPHDFATKLDWAQPVHLVSSELILDREGKQFANLRQKFGQAVRQGLKSEIITTEEHRQAVRQIVNRWADQNDKPGYTHEDLTSPTEALLKLMKRGDIPVSISGVLVRDAVDNPIGFWIMHETPDGQAMSLARVSIGHLDGIKGSAEFGAVKMAEMLQERGINEICLGGSETASLNTFKEKLGVVRSMHLSSLLVKRDHP